MESIIYNNICLNIPSRYNIDNLKNRFDNNSYESDEYNLVNNILDSQDIVLEVGACLGYLSVVASKRANKVIAVEANPELYKALEKTKQDNHTDNLFFVNTMIDKNDNETRVFYTYDLIVAGSHHRTDRENPDNNNIWNQNIVKYDIVTTSIETLENQYYVKFNTIIMDIEGGELDFLTKYKDYIGKNIKKIIVELHGRFMNIPDFNNQCLAILSDIGFCLSSTSNGTYYLTKMITL